MIFTRGRPGNSLQNCERKACRSANVAPERREVLRKARNHVKWAAKYYVLVQAN